jgi:hypothetical protein
MDTTLRSPGHDVEVRLSYIKPTVKIMNETEILAAFQMTAAKISAAGCWWGSCTCAGS